LVSLIPDRPVAELVLYRSGREFLFRDRLDLTGINAALTADPVWQDGWFATPPTRGFQAMGRVYAGWGLSQAFHREEIWRKIGFSSLEVVAAARTASPARAAGDREIRARPADDGWGCRCWPVCT
jgi:hypothetical protein